METLTVKTRYKTELVDITDQVKEAVIKSGVKDGAVVVFVPHSTCSIFIFENRDHNLTRDLLQKLHELVPSEAKYAHVGDNADAHIKASLMKANVTIPLKDARMMLGTWQGIFIGEFDGPRERTVHISFLR